jgi:hypothetical protein
MPSLQRATHLFRELQTRWGGWIETGPDGTFVIVQTPERISDLDELLGAVENWVTQQTFLAVRFHLEGRVYVMRRDGFIEQRTAITGRLTFARQRIDSAPAAYETRCSGGLPRRLRAGCARRAPAAVADVIAHCLCAELELLRDLLRRTATLEQAADLRLAWREMREEGQRALPRHPTSARRLRSRDAPA